jgi:hypothetical protein
MAPHGAVVKKTAFDEFVKSQQQPEVPEGFWEIQRDEWLRFLDELYHRIEGFLGKYVSSGEIKIEYIPIVLDEENIGRYQTRKALLRIGRSVVTLSPVGTLLIGSKGRVDVVGPRGTTVPILLISSRVQKASDMIRIQVGIGGKMPEPPQADPSEIEWVWKMATRPPERRFIELSQETFFEMILEVANG